MRAYEFKTYALQPAQPAKHVATLSFGQDDHEQVYEYFELDLDKCYEKTFTREELKKIQVETKTPRVGTLIRTIFEHSEADKFIIHFINFELPEQEQSP